MKENTEVDIRNKNDLHTEQTSSKIYTLDEAIQLASDYFIK